MHRTIKMTMRAMTVAMVAMVLCLPHAVRADCADDGLESCTVFETANTKCSGGDPYACEWLGGLTYCYVPLDTCASDEWCLDPIGTTGATCFECYEDWHCGSGAECNDYECEALPLTCADYPNTAGDCSWTGNTECIGGDAYECKDLGDATCMQLIDSCSSSEHCYDPVSPNQGAQCFECHEDWHCGTDAECTDFTCAPTTCDGHPNTNGACWVVGNTECAGNNPYECQELGSNNLNCYVKIETCGSDEHCADPWGTTGAGCFECTEDSHCGAGQECSDYQCAALSCDDYADTDGGCLLVGNTTCSGNNPYECVELGSNGLNCYVKQDTCGADEHCGDPWVGGGAQCFDCTEDSHCGTGEECVDNVCAALSCDAYADTDGGCLLVGNTTCSGNNPYECVELGSNGLNCYVKQDTCTGGDVCYDPVSPTQGAQCFECYEDDQCGQNSECVDYVCVPDSCTGYPDTAGECTFENNTTCVDNDPYNCVDLGNVQCYVKTDTCGDQWCYDPVSPTAGAECFECTEDWQCGDGYECDDYTCIALPSECDDYPDTGGPCILTGNTQCMGNDPYECTDLGDATCYVKTTTCAEGEYCVDPWFGGGAECFECEGDWHCDAGEECVDYSCQYIDACDGYPDTAGSCILLGNTKCVDGDAYECEDLGDDWCYNLSAECAADEHCYDPVGTTGATCYECSEDEHCGVGKECVDFVCEYVDPCDAYPDTAGSCLLLGNTQCEGGDPYACVSLDVGWCYAMVTACADDEVCYDPWFGGGAQCFECVEDSDCGADQECADYTCIALTPCEEQADNAGACLTEGSTVCDDDNNIYTCTDIGGSNCYLKSSDCVGQGVCYQATMDSAAECVECVGGADCGANQECVDNICVDKAPCEGVADSAGPCVAAGAGTCKDNVAYQCQEVGGELCYMMLESCGDQYCYSSLSIGGAQCLECVIDIHCGPGLSCVDEVCVGDGPTCEELGSEAGSCEVAGLTACVDDAVYECKELSGVTCWYQEQDCGDAYCWLPEGSTEALCVECREDSHCSAGELCADQICIDASATCGDVPGSAGPCTDPANTICASGNPYGCTETDSGWCYTQIASCAANEECVVNAGQASCVDPSACDDLPSEGACEGSVLSSCASGSLVETDCAASGQACAMDDATGLYACVDACSCGDRVCGDDGCGNSCGSCADGETCDEAGQCVAASECGDVGDAGACDGNVLQRCDGGALTTVDCAANGQVCELVAESGVYECVDSSCEPSCSGLECGDDGCGGVCGVCEGEQVCDAGRCSDSGTDPGTDPGTNPGEGGDGTGGGTVDENPTPKASDGCVTAGPVVAPFALLVGLVLMLLWLPRRRRS